MTTVVKDAIAASLAALTKVTNHADLPFDFGSDMSCADDVDPGAIELKGGDQTLIAQAIVRRLDTPRGALPDDENYGFDLRGLANVGVTTADLASIAGRIRAESIKDDRISDVSVRVDPGVTSRALLIQMSIVPTSLFGAAFSLTLNASSASILIDAIRSER